MAGRGSPIIKREIKTNKINYNKMKVKSVKYNWHQVGSVQDRDGSGEDWTRCEFAKNFFAEQLKQNIQWKNYQH